MVIADLADARIAERAIAVGTYASDLPTALKRALARVLVRLQLVPPIFPIYAVHSCESTTPAFVREAAHHAGVEVRAWFLLIEPGPDHKRPVFFLFTQDPDACLVVKFSRLVHDRRKAEREARGLAAAHGAGPVAAAHAPTVLADFELSGHHAVIQTALPGQSVGRMVGGWGSRRRKLDQMEPVVEWLCEIARATTHRRSSLGADVRELIDRGWSGGDAAHLTQVAAATPALFQHGDLADGNVIVGQGRFIAVDWELARAEGFPLWDLVYLAVCALPLVDGALGRGAADREENHVRYLNELFRGRAASSPQFFRWLRTSAVASGLNLETVPEVVALGLRWYATLQARLHERGELPTGSGWAPLERFAAQWLSDPDLGISWPAWRRSVGSS
jgi:aminoglycoside phosphotransferase (APT) family kinase protein